MIALALSLWLLAVISQPGARAAEESDAPPVETIVAAMVEQGRLQDLKVKSFRAIRRFEAANPRFHVGATLAVMTTFQEPDHYHSEEISFQGSKFIRERVFDKILEEEQSATKKEVKAEGDILPENYKFEMVGREPCGDRQCYKLAIQPKRKSKFLLKGFIWVDTQDYGLVRVQGSPSKRPSLWTLHTEIDRQYENRYGVWMTKYIKSKSDVLIAGSSTLSITYDYVDEVMRQN